MDDPEQEEVKLHDWNIIPKRRVASCYATPPTPKRLTGSACRHPVTWTVSDIAKAGCLLATPPLPAAFQDEQEMRSVYTLIYDVFRYKNVLAQALDEVSFYETYPELMEKTSHVWLLFYDLYHRSFKKRDTASVYTAGELFDASGLMDAEEALWRQRVKLAASVARLRIQSSALSLSELLPPQLRDERVSSQVAAVPLTCWINVRKVRSIDELKVHLERLFDLKAVRLDEQFKPNTFRWDKHCPLTIVFHASMRPKLVRSELVKNYSLIMQDKSFCLGPATFHKVVSNLQLAGNVIQTHINSPRTTAYLANLLTQNEKIKKLIAFSAGKRKSEYEAYFHQLGITNITLLTDRIIDVSPDVSFMEEVVAVFATPPNSYSAVTDPIDLVCGRGGDLAMLEILTESEESDAAKERVMRILEEQKKTLMFAMSRPQIQLVLYETHSLLDAENHVMVNRSVTEINRLAKLHHATLQGKIFPSNDERNTKEAASPDKAVSDDVRKPEGGESTRSSLQELYRNYLYADERVLDTVIVPNTDIFKTLALPDLCLSENACLDLPKQGCYLALVQRKEVIRLNNKYMIKMAEHKGLFGQTSSSSQKSKGGRAKRRDFKSAPVALKSKRKIKEEEVARIAAPTHASLLHNQNASRVEVCPKYNFAKPVLPSPYRTWWAEATRHMVGLRKTLVKNKLIPPKDMQQGSSKSMVNTFIHSTLRLDEIVAKTNQNSSFPIYPKLRLPRPNIKMEKITLRLPITAFRLVHKYVD